MLFLKPKLALIDGSLRGSYKPLAMQPCASPLITSLPTPGRRPTIGMSYVSKFITLTKSHVTSHHRLSNWNLSIWVLCIDFNIISN